MVYFIQWTAYPVFGRSFNTKKYKKAHNHWFNDFQVRWNSPKKWEKIKSQSGWRARRKTQTTEFSRDRRATEFWLTHRTCWTYCTYWFLLRILCFFFHFLLGTRAVLCLRACASLKLTFIFDYSMNMVVEIPLSAILRVVPKNIWENSKLTDFFRVN